MIIKLFLLPKGWLVIFIYGIIQLILGLILIFKNYVRNFWQVLLLGILLGISTYLNILILDRPGLLNISDRVASILPINEIIFLTIIFSIVYFFKRSNN